MPIVSRKATPTPIVREAPPPPTPAPQIVLPKNDDVVKAIEAFQEGIDTISAQNRNVTAMLSQRIATKKAYVATVERDGDGRIVTIRMEEE